MNFTATPKKSHKYVEFYKYGKDGINMHVKSQYYTLKFENGLYYDTYANDIKSIENITEIVETMFKNLMFFSKFHDSDILQSYYYKKNTVFLNYEDANEILNLYQFKKNLVEEVCKSYLSPDILQKIIDENKELLDENDDITFHYNEKDYEEKDDENK